MQGVLLVNWFDKERLSLIVRLWTFASVFVVPMWILDLEIAWLAAWLALGAIFGLGWTWRHRQQPDVESADPQHR
jgi:hypothetical protein